MDSVTQIVLGAAVGEAVCGRKIGNKAMVWGAIAGTIPDLDVMLAPFQDSVQYLSNHRGFTHSFLFAFLFSPLFAWLLLKIYPNGKANFKDWTLLFFLGFVTHIALDSFTTWGTQLFFPFSNYGVAFYSVFVIDPLYTVPFAVLLIWAAFKKKESKVRTKLNYIGIGLSSFYLMVTVLNKNIANKVFEENFASQGIKYESYISKPTPFNSILWSVTAKTKEGYYSGFYSLLDNQKEIEFTFLENNHHLLNPYKENPKLKRLIEITKNYYTVEKSGDRLMINDLRFGQFNGWQGDEKAEFVFVYDMVEKEDELIIEQKEYMFKPDNEYLMAYFNRIGGKK
ncbi:metal-dependent hydrolase [Flexithrix dorotheae]|uniref:metal-dependent hydrolase n=1 Tax=Flexithrix dorotheae TaxID=70993 RepID=UPI0003781AD5|nr:metal-dependent hydrolase [Flexithrix dorotheae]